MSTISARVWTGNPVTAPSSLTAKNTKWGGTAELHTDEDGRAVIKLFISFIETPHARLMKFVFYDDRVIVRFRESPSLAAGGWSFCTIWWGETRKTWKRR